MLPDWINELVDEYSNQKIHDARVLRLALAYVNEPDEIMMAAVMSYIRENEFFPRTAGLNPYVINAQENARGEKPYGKIEQQAKRKYSYDEMLVWEQQRGTMPPDDLLDTEWLIEEAAGKMRP